VKVAPALAIAVIILRTVVGLLTAVFAVSRGYNTRSRQRLAFYISFAFSPAQDPTLKFEALWQQVFSSNLFLIPPELWCVPFCVSISTLLSRHSSSSIPHDGTNSRVSGQLHEPAALASRQRILHGKHELIYISYSGSQRKPVLPYRERLCCQSRFPWATSSPSALVPH
jgi:hypothetical protein